MLVKTMLIGSALLGLVAATPVPAQAQAAQPEAGAKADTPPRPVAEQRDDQVRARELLTLVVTNGQDTIGSVSDLVLAKNGRLDAVVVSVGGWLGVGQKEVALAWDSVELTEQKGQPVIRTAATREELEAMPDFKTIEAQQAETNRQATLRKMQQQQQKPVPDTAPPAATE